MEEYTNRDFALVRGEHSEIIIIENTNKRIIRLYPKDTELGNNFYKQFGFKWFGNNEGRMVEQEVEEL